MKYINNSYYQADDNKTFIRKEDYQIMGHIIFLAENDSIDNYEEVELTEENDIEGLLNLETNTNKVLNKKKK